MRDDRGLGTLAPMTIATSFGIEWLSALGDALLAKESGAAIAAKLGASAPPADPEVVRDRLIVALLGGGAVTLLLDGEVAHQAWIDPAGRAPALATLVARWGAPQEGPRTGPFAPIGLTFPLGATETTEVRLLVHIADETVPREAWAIRDLVVLRQPRLR